ncbi:MAG: UDP-N-acetylmuramate--L-alanine ligase [Nitrospirota bacterium]
MFERYRVIHFVGIGGIGMSGIAELLHNLGYEVTGSDLRESEATTRLRVLGIKVHIGHRAENIDDAHVLVVSSAVAGKNPEVSEARRRSIPVIPRAEMLAELTNLVGNLKYRILVAGAHGKTTTTSLIATVLAQNALDPTVVIGGKLKALGSNTRLGTGEFLVAEADESDGSFLKLSPTISVVTNIDREHMDFFRTMESLKEAFLAFINKVPFYGTSVICIENKHLRELLPFVERRYLAYGLTRKAELYAENIRKGFMSVTFDAVYKGLQLGNFELPVPGFHNVLNSLATIGVALVLNLDIALVKDALRGFSGIQRRLEFKGEAGGIKIYDDYGHHPTEIRATLKAIREGLFSGKRRHGRLVVLFQPHRYTRTKDLMDEFAVSFHAADMLLLLEIYPAGEKPVRGVSTMKLCRKIRGAGQRNILYLRDREQAIAYGLEQCKEGDILLTLGAGNVWQTGEELLRKLQEKNEG